VHNAIIVRDWFNGEAMRRHRIKKIWWPAFSPDLNPIENFWGWMVNRMTTIEARNEEELWDWVFQCWNEMGEVRNYWEHLIDSMPDRLALVFDLDGDMTKY
jgi:DDE superfamily endonuclease